jgi:hypothetical protein
MDILSKIIAVVPRLRCSTILLSLSEPFRGADVWRACPNGPRGTHRPIFILLNGPKAWPEAHGHSG